MNRQDVIDHLQIIRTWVAVGIDPIYLGTESNCCESVEKWIDDALALLKEQPEIVRCKNCEYYRGDVLSGYCDRWFRQTGGEETYCSEGRQVVKRDG